jgi:hypothetical protein
MSESKIVLPKTVSMTYIKTKSEEKIIFVVEQKSKKKKSKNKEEVNNVVEMLRERINSSAVLVSKSQSQPQVKRQYIKVAELDLNTMKLSLNLKEISKPLARKLKVLDDLLKTIPLDAYLKK